MYIRTAHHESVDEHSASIKDGNGYFDHATPAIDHNLYVHGSYVFEEGDTSEWSSTVP